MKKVILDELQDPKVIFLSGIGYGIPIFLIRDGMVKGLLVKEKDGWIVRLGEGVGSTGFHETREAALKSVKETRPDSEFYIDLKYDKS
ncbi:hypothetical protein ES703_61302 [subsurface metagenome]